MDAEHGLGHVLLVVNVCCLRQEDLKKNISCFIIEKYFLIIHLWETNFSESSEIIIDVVRVFEVKTSAAPLPLVTVKYFPGWNNIGSTEVTKLGKVDSITKVLLQSWINQSEISIKYFVSTNQRSELFCVNQWSITYLLLEEAPL